MGVKKINLWSVCVCGGYYIGYIFWMIILVRKLLVIGNLCI